ncbi:MAG: sensor histidine kinase [Candidatus Dormibacteria bacterium]
MAEAAGIGAGKVRRSALAGFLATAGFAWPILAVVLGALAATAITGDHLRMVALDRAIVPEGWTANDFRNALAGIGLSPGGYAIAVDIAKGAMVGAYFAVAAIAWQRRRFDPGALLVAYFLVVFAGNWEVEPARMPAWAGPVLGALDLVAWSAFLNFFLLFPDNRYRPRWTAWLGIGIPLLALAGVAVRLPAEVQTGIWLAMLLLAISLQVVRYRRHSGPAQRQQARWLLVGFGSTVALMIAVLALGMIWHPLPPARGAILLGIAGQAVGQLAFIPIPMAIAVATTRYHLWEMDRVVNRALVYGALTGGLGLVYVGVAFVVGSRLSGEAGSALSILAAIIVAVLLQPAKARVELALNRAMYGRREDPYSALSRLGRRLGDNLAADDVLPLIATTVKESLRSPFVEIKVTVDGGFGVSSGDQALRRRAVTVALHHQGTRVGEMLVAPRLGEDRLGEADLRLLRDLAFHAGVAIHEIQLRRELLASREKLVIAREEERRRLSRVLHDDLGATLAAQKLKAGGILAALQSNPSVASGQLVTLESDLGTAIRRIRELAYELRPPALEDLGLQEALATMLRTHEGNGVAMELRASAAIPTQPAAVELSVYRIVEQAVANTVRHADAHRCVVELFSDVDAVGVVVTDDGKGIPTANRPGLGISSMRERAEELGGTFTIEPRPGGGTRLMARIPVGLLGS